MAGATRAFTGYNGRFSSTAAHHARQNGAKVVSLDLQRVDSDRLATPDLFLRDLAELIVRKLRLDISEVENFWQGSLGSQDKLTYLMEDYVLPETDSAIVLTLDEVDRLLQTPFHTDFFALLRSWHNSRALDEQWDNFNMVLVISTSVWKQLLMHRTWMSAIRRWF